MSLMRKKKIFLLHYVVNLELIGISIVVNLEQPQNSNSSIMVVFEGILIVSIDTDENEYFPIVFNFEFPSISIVFKFEQL